MLIRLGRHQDEAPPRQGSHWSTTRSSSPGEPDASVPLPPDTLTKRVAVLERASRHCRQATRDHPTRRRSTPALRSCCPASASRQARSCARGQRLLRRHRCGPRPKRSLGRARRPLGTAACRGQVHRARSRLRWIRPGAAKVHVDRAPRRGLQHQHGCPAPRTRHTSPRDALRERSAFRRPQGRVPPGPRRPPAAVSRRHLPSTSAQKYRQR